MEISSFARIGKGVLTKAIGLQKNHKEIYESAAPKLNVEASPCSTCPIHQAKSLLETLNFKTEFDSLHEQCLNCSESIWDKQYEVRYINEKNQFGYQKKLGSFALKLLLLYHFLQPDALGLIKDVNIKDLATQIGCTVATIKNSNDYLVEYGYIYISNSGFYDHAINIWLPEYKNYHKTAQEGGRGYLTLSKQMLDDVLIIETINTLRLTIKGILEVDNASIFGTRNLNFEYAEISYKQLGGFLPNYCKRNVIQRSLQKASSVLEVDFNEKSVTFRLKHGCKPKEVRDELKQNCKHKMIEYIDTLNTLFTNVSNELVKENTTTLLTMFNINIKENYTNLILPDDVYDSLATMCVQYSTELVKQAISTVYNNYTNRGQLIDNFGALVRTTIKKQSFLSKAS